MQQATTALRALMPEGSVRSYLVDAAARSLHRRRAETLADIGQRQTATRSVDGFSGTNRRPRPGRR